MKLKSFFKNIIAIIIIVFVFFSVLELSLRLFRPDVRKLNQAYLQLMGRAQNRKADWDRYLKTNFRGGKVEDWDDYLESEKEGIKYKYRLPNNITFQSKNILLSHELSEKKVFTVSTNSFGFRNAEFKFRKEKNTIRIVCLGDSWTYGFGLNKDELYSKQLNEISKKDFPNRKIEVINAGILGNTSYGGLYLFKNIILDLKPDIIIICFGQNDFRKQHEMPQSLEKTIFILWRFEIFHLLRDIFQPLMSLQKPEMNTTDREIFTARTFKENLEEIIESSRKKDINVILLNQSMTWLPAIYIDYLQNTVLKVAESKSVPVIDTIKSLKNYSDKKLVKKSFDHQPNWTKEFEKLGIKDATKERIFKYYYFFNDFMHLNKMGNFVIANETVKLLKEKQLIN